MMVEAPVAAEIQKKKNIKKKFEKKKTACDSFKVKKW